MEALKANIEGTNTITMRFHWECIVEDEMLSDTSFFTMRRLHNGRRSSDLMLYTLASEGRPKRGTGILIVVKLENTNDISIV